MNRSRLIFEKIEENDFERFFEIHSDNKLSTTGYAPINYDVAKKVFQNSLTHWEKYNFGTWKLKLKENPIDIIGFGGIYYREVDFFGMVVNMGIALDKKYWGHGLAYKTAMNAIEFGFQKLNLEKIYAFTDRKNISAINLIEKCKMNFEISNKSEVIYSIKKNCR